MATTAPAAAASSTTAPRAAENDGKVAESQQTQAVAEGVPCATSAPDSLERVWSFMPFPDVS